MRKEVQRVSKTVFNQCHSSERLAAKQKFSPSHERKEMSYSKKKNSFTFRPSNVNENMNETILFLQKLIR